MSKLPQPLGEGMREPFDQEEIDEARAQFNLRYAAGEKGTLASEPRPKWHWLAAAAVVGLAVLSWGRYDNDRVVEPTRDATGVVPVAATEPIRLDDGSLPGVFETRETDEASYGFDDGSNIVVQPSTKLATTTNDGQVVRFDLEGGEAHVRVTPGGPRTWKIHTELADIEVIGTDFTVTESDDAVEVRVREGKVAVLSRYLEEGRLVLTDGESVIVRRPEEPEPDPATTEPSSQRSAKKSWRKMARARQFDLAYESLGADGLARETERARTVSELFDLADVARLSGHPQEAVEPLSYLVERFPHDARAGIAAFTLAGIHLTKLRNPRQAADLFERAIQLGVPPSLREAAYVRAIEARVATSSKARARSLISRYLKLFPTGNYRDQVNAWNAKLKD